MSTLWTPSGERPVPRKPDPAAGGAPEGGGAGGPGGAGGRPGQAGAPSEEQVRAELADLQAQLARTPAAVVVANHAFGLFELAALHLSLQPPQLDQARLAIDALGALVEGLGDRLGSNAQELSTGLSQLRMAYVQISAAGAEGSPGQGEATGEAGSAG